MSYAGELSKKIMTMGEQELRKTKEEIDCGIWNAITPEAQERLANIKRK